MGVPDHRAERDLGTVQQRRVGGTLWAGAGGPRCLHGGGARPDRARHGAGLRERRLRHVQRPQPPVPAPTSEMSDVRRDRWTSSRTAAAPPSPSVVHPVPWSATPGSASRSSPTRATGPAVPSSTTTSPRTWPATRSLTATTASIRLLQHLDLRGVHRHGGRPAGRLPAARRHRDDRDHRALQRRPHRDRRPAGHRDRSQGGRHDGLSARRCRVQLHQDGRPYQGRSSRCATTAPRTSTHGPAHHGRRAVHRRVGGP